MPIFTINGHPQPRPEIIGSMPRRNRLFVECERRLADDPLAGSSAVGRPVADGLGLERLVAKLTPLFEKERSLIRWIALRGAFTELFIRVLDPDSAVVPPEELEQVMGLEGTNDAYGDSHLNLAQPWRTALSPDQQQAALGVASSIFMRVADYNRYSKMNVTDVNADPRCRISQAVGLDCIAWSAIALLRLEIAPQFFLQVPEPDLLSKPGWYTDPLFAKSERFWDGSDWTARCRAKNSGEVFIPLT